MAYTVTNIISAQALNTSGDFVGAAKLGLQTTSTKFSVTASTTGVYGGDPTGLNVKWVALPNDPGTVTAALCRQFNRIAQSLSLNQRVNDDGVVNAQAIVPFAAGLFVLAWLEVPAGLQAAATATVTIAESP